MDLSDWPVGILTLLGGLFVIMISYAGYLEGRKLTVLASLIFLVGMFLSVEGILFLSPWW